MTKPQKGPLKKKKRRRPVRAEGSRLGFIKHWSDFVRIWVGDPKIQVGDPKIQ